MSSEVGSSKTGIAAGGVGSTSRFSKGSLIDSELLLEPKLLFDSKLLFVSKLLLEPRLPLLDSRLRTGLILRIGSSLGEFDSTLAFGSEGVFDVVSGACVFVSEATLLFVCFSTAAEHWLTLVRFNPKGTRHAMWGLNP